VTTGDGSRPAVVVTGASTGIGEATALHLDRLGFRVYAGVRREEAAARLRARATSMLRPVFLDVTDGDSVGAAVEVVGGDTGGAGLAGLVNNAGVAVGGPLEFLPLEAFRQQLEVNVTGQLAVIQAFLPLLRAGRGRIVNISSIAGLVAGTLLGPYHASKFALEALSDSLRQELAPWGLHVAVVEPGAIATPIWAKSVAAADDPARALPPLAYERYGPAAAALRAWAARSAVTGAPPETVAAAVAHALTARRPKTRYLVGRDARLTALVARLPDRWRDRLLRRLGRGRGGPAAPGE
jgi:NAD(P)-dependent dehydrogenase (short-subunit alcohol dehydrogenase family)